MEEPSRPGRPALQFGGLSASSASVEQSDIIADATRVEVNVSVYP